MHALLQILMTLRMGCSVEGVAEGPRSTHPSRLEPQFDGLGTESSMSTNIWLQVLGSRVASFAIAANIAVKRRRIGIDQIVRQFDNQLTTKQSSWPPG